MILRLGGRLQDAHMLHILYQICITACKSDAKCLITFKVKLKFLDLKGRFERGWGWSRTKPRSLNVYRCLGSFVKHFKLFLIAGLPASG